MKGDLEHHRVSLWIAMAALSLAGCAHHSIGWPPTRAELEEVNRTATNDDGSTRMALLPAVQPDPAGGTGGFPPVRPIVDTSLPEVSHLVSADAVNLNIIDKKGAAQSVPLALVGGFATANPKRMMRRGAALGGAVGLGLSAFLAFCFVELNGLGEDSPPSGKGRPVPVGTAVGAVVVGTIVGAVLGAAVGYRKPDETYQFGSAR